jgi:hypothetical protein
MHDRVAKLMGDSHSIPPNSQFCAGMDGTRERYSHTSVSEGRQCIVAVQSPIGDDLKSKLL